MNAKVALLAALTLTNGSRRPTRLLSSARSSADHMVLQRGKRNSIWGWSRPGDTVTVEIGENRATAIAGPDGRWRASIQPPAPGGPYTLKIAGRETVQLRDVLGEFAVAGDDHKWHWADARIEGDAVIVSSQSVLDPKAVRYAWQANPLATLFNGAALPAAPFRTDITQGR